MRIETYCLMKIFIFTLFSCFFGNVYLGSYPTLYCSALMHLYIAKASSLSSYWCVILKPSQGFPVHVGSVTASPLPEGSVPGLKASSGTGQPQAVPFPPSVTGAGRGATARANPCPRELLLTEPLLFGPCLSSCHVAGHA